MTKCLIVTCPECEGLLALQVVDNGVSLQLDYGLDPSFADIAIVNRMPVCDCKPESPTDNEGEIKRLIESECKGCCRDCAACHVMERVAEMRVK